MQREKIYLILNKIPIKVLTAKDEDISRTLDHDNIRKEIFKLIVVSLRKRYDNKAADYIEKRWVENKPEIRVDE